jgi:serine/threonine-protein kinase
VPADIAQALWPEYEVERPLGRGGVGVVYLAREVALDRRVAVKVLPAERAMDPAAVDRFLREARVAASLNHPGIVPIHAVGQRGKVTYFTMEHVAGETLSQRIRRGGPMPAHGTCRLMLEIGSAVGHAHAHGVVHRDLKPPNIMLSRGGRVVVMDFGLAGISGSVTLESSDVIDGTPEYIAPELARGAAASMRSDIYALGLTWWYLLVGSHMVSADGAAATVRRHLVDNLPRRVAEEHLVPPSIRPLLSSMVERDPEARPRSVAEIVAALHRIGTRASDMPAHEAEAAATHRPQQHPSSRSHDSHAATERIERLADDDGGGDGA